MPRLIASDAYLFLLAFQRFVGCIKAMPLQVTANCADPERVHRVPRPAFAVTAVRPGDGENASPSAYIISETTHPDYIQGMESTYDLTDTAFTIIIYIWRYNGACRFFRPFFLEVPAPSMIGS